MSNATALALRLAKQTARRFGQERLRKLVRDRHKPAADGGRIPPDIEVSYAELGLGIAHLPSSVGGVGLGPLSLCVVAESLARGDVNAAFALPQPGAFADVLVALGSIDQAKLWLRPLFERPVRAHGALVIGAPGAIVAEEQGDVVRLSGQVPAVWQAQRADRFVVVANAVSANKAPTGQRRAFVLTRAHAGLAVGPGHVSAGLPLARAASVAFVDVAVPKNQWLEEHDVQAGLVQAFALQSLRMGSLALGTAHAASSYMVNLAEQRRQVGPSVANFHSMGFLLVDMHLACEAAFRRLRQAAGSAEAPEELERVPFAMAAEAEVAAARRAADEVAFFVTESALQMLSDAGEANDAHPIASWHEDIKCLAQSYRADAYFSPGMQATPPDANCGWRC